MRQIHPLGCSRNNKCARGGSRTHKTTLVLSQQHIPFCYLGIRIGSLRVWDLHLTFAASIAWPLYSYYTNTLTYSVPLESVYGVIESHPSNHNRATNNKLFNKIELTRALYALILLINYILAHSA